MIAVTLRLTSEASLAFDCPEEGPLFDQMSALVSGLSENRIDYSKTWQLQIDDARGSRGIAISPRHVLWVETEPDDAFAISATQTLAQSAPYMRIPGFMPDSARDRIVEFALTKMDKFATSSIKSGAGDTNRENLRIRRSSVMNDLRDLPKTFADDIREIAPDVMRVLDLDPLDEFEMELQLTAHNDGAFYKMHRDNNTASTSRRQLTFVYYFHQHPKRFTGGELRLYDMMQGSEIAAESHVDIEPEDNCLLLFPSNVPHEVLEVICPSKTFEDSRFTLNGWLRAD